MPSPLDELLLDYKNAEGVLGTAIVADSPAALKLLAAFTLFPLPAWRRPRTKMPTDARARWRWLWAGFEGDEDAPDFLVALAAAASVPAQTAFNLWPAIVASRLVFPDGSISQDAAALVRAHVVKHLPRPARGTTRKE
jgi:hypothetical protein